MKISIVSLLVISAAVLLCNSCTTIPEVTSEQAMLQGVTIYAIDDVIKLINEKRLVPNEVNQTFNQTEHPIIWYYDLTSMLINRLLFRDPEPGNLNIGYLREENPQAAFPIMGDTVETDTFSTFFNVWQFHGKEGQHIDLLVRSIETFPAGIFFPYFIVLDHIGNIIDRQDHVVFVDAGAMNPEGMMVWLDDVMLPETGTYYIMVFSDPKDQVMKERMIRLGNERLSIYEVFAKEEWGIHTSFPGAVDLLIDRLIVKESIYVPLVEHLTAGSRFGKYELILWIYE